MRNKTLALLVALTAVLSAAFAADTPQITHPATTPGTIEANWPFPKPVVVTGNTITVQVYGQLPFTRVCLRSPQGMSAIQQKNNVNSSTISFSGLAPGQYYISIANAAAPGYDFSAYGFTLEGVATETVEVK